MLTQARAALPAMDRAAAGVRRQLQAAREEKDVVKSLCLNDKLNQIDLATRTATDRMSGLEAAVAANDAERVKHQYTVILVLRDRVTTLVSEANQCIGEDVGFVGESNVTMEIDSDIPESIPPASRMTRHQPTARHQSAGCREQYVPEHRRTLDAASISS